MHSNIYIYKIKNGKYDILTYLPKYSSLHFMKCRKRITSNRISLSLFFIYKTVCV